MVGKRSAAVMAAVGLMLGGAASAAASDTLPGSDTSLVQVWVNSEADVDRLSTSYDLAEYKKVEDDGSIQLNIDADASEIARLRDMGFKIGQTIEDASTRAARAEERDRTAAAEALAADLAEDGAPRSGIRSQGKSVVPNPGRTVIQRANVFTNYAGRFLYVEAHNKDSGITGTSTAFGPSLALSFAGADGAFGDAVNMGRFIDTDTSPDVYMYHRQLIRLTGAAAQIPAKDMTVRVASSNGDTDTFKVTEWLGNELPPYTDGYLKGFFNRYQDPTENRAQLDRLAAEFPNLVTPVNLPNLTNGYQRKAQTFTGVLINGAPYAGQTGTLSGSGTASAISVTSKAWGHEGGNNLSIELRNPGQASQPLGVVVNGNDVVVNLATSDTGALTSTAAQVVAAINASPEASALVSATTYRGNAGAGVAQAVAKLMLKDYLNAPAHVQRGPFQQRVYRIGSVRDGSKVGVFLYCQQHAREWTTGLTCVETAERLVRNYALDARTKQLMDNVEVFVLANVNPDGGHYSMYDFASQRRNMTMHCALTDRSTALDRNVWGVDLNRNNTQYTLFDGYFGASSSCSSDTFAGPSEASEPEIKNEQWVVDNFPNIKFANNIHSYGGYFMWAPGSYRNDGFRTTAPAPNIGIEKYFFEAGEKILQRIKEHRGTVILPERTGPIADVLYSAAGNSADDQWYRKGIISYSFETGADRFISTESGTQQIISGFQPPFAGPGTNGGAGSSDARLVNEGRDQAMEFASGNFGMVESAYDYAMDTTPPSASLEIDTDKATAPPVNFRFNLDGEAAVIHYTTDGSEPTLASRTYNNQRARGIGEVLTLDRIGVHDIKWFAVDIKGNRSATQTQRVLIGPEQGVGGSVPATLALTLGNPATFGAFTPGVARDYTATTTANVVSTAGDATLTVADPSATHTGHLVNGSFFLPQKLQANAQNGTYAPVGSAANPTVLHTYSGPVSNDQVTIGLKQSIGTHDALRTGAYSKTLTYTLSTTTP
jgi:hypothetical protein